MATSKPKNKPKNKKSNVARSAKKQSFKFQWWMAAIGVGVIALVGIIVLRFSHASTNGVADFTVDPANKYEIAVLQAKNGSAVKANACLNLVDGYGGVEQVRVWYRRLTADPQNSKKSIPLYDGYYVAATNQAPSQLQYGGSWLDNNQSANSPATFTVNYPDLGFTKYQNGTNVDSKLYVGMKYGINLFEQKKDSQKYTDVLLKNILENGGQAISLNNLQLCEDSAHQKMTNKQVKLTKISGTKSKEKHLKLTTIPPYSQSFDSVKSNPLYIGTIQSKYAGNFYITACTVPQGGSIYTVKSTAWFADPRYVMWGKDGVATDFWMKDNGEIRGATSGQWLYGVVASFDSESLDYASSNSLQFGVHDYNAFVDKDDSAWLPDINMTELKQCSNAQKMPPQSKFIQQPATGNTTNPDIPPVPPNDSFPLQLGSEGPNVAALQKSMGFSTQDQDGIFGPTTLYWVNQFKAKANMAQNGIIDPITWNSWIRNGAAPTYGPAVPPATPPANYGYDVCDSSGNCFGSGGIGKQTQTYPAPKVDNRPPCGTLDLRSLWSGCK